MTKKTQEYVKKLLDQLHQATTIEEARIAYRACGTICTQEQAEELVRLNLEVKALG